MKPLKIVIIFYYRVFFFQKTECIFFIGQAIMLISAKSKNDKFMLNALLA